MTALRSMAGEVRSGVSVTVMSTRLASEITPWMVFDKFRAGELPAGEYELPLPYETAIISIEETKA